MQPWLSGKRLVIIGGTAGIGLSAARAFIDHGARVVVVGNNPANGEQAASLLQSKGIVELGDASQPETASNAVDVCVNTWGGLDGLFHIAGGSGRKMGDGPLHEMSIEGWNYTLSVNLTSLMLSNRAAVQAFLRQQAPGTILNIGSVLGSSPSRVHFATHAYAAAKSAVIGFSKSIAAYYAPQQIRVNVLAPSLIETPMSQRAAHDDAILNFIRTKQPLNGGHMGQPSDLDGAALYFMSDYSKFTTGQVLTVDGGWSISEGQY